MKRPSLISCQYCFLHLLQHALKYLASQWILAILRTLVVHRSCTTIDVVEFEDLGCFVNEI